MSTDDAAVKLAKFLKKLAKVAKQLKAGTLDADEARQEEARLKKKISKWEAAVAEAVKVTAAADAHVVTDNKQQKRGRDKALKDGAVVENNGSGKAAKKQKKDVNGNASANDENGHHQARHNHHHHHHSKHHNTHAEVGDAKLATSGKSIIKSLYNEHAEVAAFSAERVAQIREEREITIEGFGPNDDFVAGGS